MQTSLTLDLSWNRAKGKKKRVEQRTANGAIIGNEFWALWTCFSNTNKERNKVSCWVEEMDRSTDAIEGPVCPCEKEL